MLKRQNINTDKYMRTLKYMGHTFQFSWYSEFLKICQHENCWQGHH